MVPHFIIAGAGKSGTTALWTQLSKHPDICMASRKEPNFFTQITSRFEGGEAINPHKSGQFHRGFEWYKSLFQQTGTLQKCGEASVWYFHAPDAANLIAQHAPDVRLVFMLRNPTDRVYSNYRYEVRNGNKLPSFEELAKKRTSVFERYCDASHYKKHLHRFYENFSEDQILILLQEEYKQDPKSILNKVYLHIGVDSSITGDISLNNRVNVGGIPRFKPLQHLIWHARHTRMTKHVPMPIKKPLSWGLHKIHQANIKTADPIDLPEPLRHELDELFAEDRQYVAMRLGRRLKCWPN